MEPDTNRTEPASKRDSASRRWLWFVGLWAASVAVFGALVFGLRWLLGL